MVSSANLAAQCYVLLVILIVEKCDSNSAELNCYAFEELSQECPSYLPQYLRWPTRKKGQL